MLLRLVLSLILAFYLCSIGEAKTHKQLKLQTKKNWYNELNLSQWKALDNNFNEDTTEFSNVWYYQFNSLYSTSINFAAIKSWTTLPDKVESNQGEDQEDQDEHEAHEPSTSLEHHDSFYIDDLLLTLERTDTISLAGKLYLPTSKDSQDAGRRFAISIEPYVNFGSQFNLELRSEFIYYNNAYDTFENKGKDHNPIYGFSPKADLVAYLKRNWTFLTQFTILTEWNSLQERSSTYTFSLGPEYKWNRNTSGSLQYYAESQEFSDKLFFSQQTSSIGASLLIKF